MELNEQQKINLNNCKIVINKIFIDKDNLCHNENTKEPFIIFDIYDSLTQEIKCHNFCILFYYTLSGEEKEKIKNGIFWQKKIIQKSIDNNTLDIDFPGWDEKTIIVDIYVIEQNEYLKGFNFGLKMENREKRFRDCSKILNKNN